MRPDCCRLDQVGQQCQADATWQIFYGPSFLEDASSFACDDHLVELMSDAVEHRVFRVTS